MVAALRCKQVYLLTPIDCATLSHAKSPSEIIAGSMCCERYLKHIATRKTVTCRLLAHT